MGQRFASHSEHPRSIRLSTIVTDVIRKTVEGCYLSSSVIYSPEIAKHVVVFQAFFNGTSAVFPSHVHNMHG